jgi:hypothetical protein
LCTCRIFVPQAMEMQAVFSTFARLSRLLNWNCLSIPWFWQDFMIDLFHS